jgi:hypothetical protein
VGGFHRTRLSSVMIRGRCSLQGPCSRHEAACSTWLPIVNRPPVRVCQVGAVHHTWWSFTVSISVQYGLGLLRHLRPPSRTLAFSRPPKEGKRGGSSPVPTPETRATRSGLLDAGCPRGQRLPTFGLDTPSTVPLWVWGAAAIFTPPPSRRFQQRFLASA